jgi:tRNA (guanine37-N1)-methyltransferase
MKIDILTLFPEMFTGPFDHSIIKRAQTKGLVEIKIHNLRQWTFDKRKTVDDRPFGGGAGMVMMVEPVYKALTDLKSNSSKVILLTPQGKTFNQRFASDLSVLNHLILICGHYEGIDERIRQYLIDEEISIGDYVLTGGELPAMIVADSIIRLIPGVLKKKEATINESFSQQLKIENSIIVNLLEYPQYTRPAEFNGWKVPEIVMSGNHQEIEKWKLEQAFINTKKKRPDLLK